MYQFRRRTRHPWAPRRKWRGMGRKYTSSSTLGSGERYELSQRGLGQSPCRKWFYCNLISVHCLRWQQVTANSSPFRPEKWGYCTSQSKKWGYWYPSYPRKLRLWTARILYVDWPLQYSSTHTAELISPAACNFILNTVLESLSLPISK